MTDYLGGLTGIAWMALVHAPFVLVPFLPVALVLALLAWCIERTPGWTPAAPRPAAHVWRPSLLTLGMLAFAPPFFQPQNGDRSGPLPWPAWVIGGLLLVHLLLAARCWWRTQPGQRPLLRLLFQLWLACAAALVTSMAVTPGGALGAL